MRSLPLITTLAATAAALTLTPALASAESMVGLDTRNRLVTFQSSKADTVRTRAVTGLVAGEALVGLDRRPANGVIYALGNSSRLYTVDVATGRAAAVGTSTFANPLNGTNFGFDFNPMVDRIRIASNFTQNLRVVPDSGAVAANDGALKYAAGDPNAGKAPAISGSAYTNNIPMANATQLFDIDVTTDSLALQDPPNDGGLRTIGSLRQGDIQSPVGFDIASRTGNAFASLRKRGQKGTALFSIDLRTGRAAALGTIGSGRTPVTLRALTVAE